MLGTQQSAPPVYSFTAHPDPSTAPFAVPRETCLVTHQRADGFRPSHIATGALVFSTSSSSSGFGSASASATSPRPRVLLLKRAANDSMPGLWETPGGGCGATDASVLHGVARELWEEAGLVAARVGPPVGDGYLFLSRRGKLICKFNFLVDVEVELGLGVQEQVRLDPKEHQGFVWATEEEVREGRVGRVEVEFTTREQKEVVLKAFRVREQMGPGSEEE